LDSVNQPRNEVRAFLHKRILGGFKGFLTGGPLGLAAGLLSGGRQQARHANQRGTPTGTFRNLQGQIVPEMGASPSPLATREFRLSLAAQRSALAGATNPGATGGCVSGQRRVGNLCFDMSAVVPGGDPFISRASMPTGDAVMGRYGAALVPGSMVIDKAVCIRGMVLGNDGLCYNKSQVRNSDRMWPRGRRPLLTGGDMRAISTASRAASRLERTTKRLQKIGLMKKPRRISRTTQGGSHA